MSMLILKRRVGETLLIGDNIEITVMGYKGDQVVIRTRAPREVPIVREEIADRFKKSA